MKSRILSVLTVLVGSFVVIGLIAAVMIPSLLRARVAAPRRPEMQQPPPLRMPAPTTAAPARAHAATSVRSTSLYFVTAPWTGLPASASAQR